MAGGAMVLMVITLAGPYPQELERREVPREECEKRLAEALNAMRESRRIECLPLASGRRSADGYRSGYGEGYRSGYGLGYQQGWRDGREPPQPPIAPPVRPVQGGMTASQPFRDRY